MQEMSGEEMEWSVAVDADASGGRLDAVLARAVPDFSRNRIKDLILSGAVAINGRASTEPNYRVKLDDQIVLIAPEPVEAEPFPQDIPLDILYEDDDVIVINKPVGMVVHPAPGNLDGTLVNALLHHCGASLKGIGGVKRPGIVHRLDKDTSGVMVAAKTEQAHNHLAAQFADHGRTGPLHRAYIAFVWAERSRHAVPSMPPSGATRTTGCARPSARTAARRSLTMPSKRVTARRDGTSPASSARSRPGEPTRSASTWAISAIHWSPTRSMPPAT
jgi:23S rRNA pseudouridine1911/1915/1917 synthase